MKAFLFVLSLLLIISCVNGKERTYTASTPANEAVRKFLGIPLADSIDFIRWKIVLNDNGYKLNCNYGISKPNTNGFENGGIKIDIHGKTERKANHILLWNENKALHIVAINDDILQLANNDNSLMIGNGGWSYTLNAVEGTGSNSISIKPQRTAIKDSMSFTGRSPCGVPAIIPKDKLCYKLKWLIVLYGNAQENEATTCKIIGTPYRSRGGQSGTWKIINGNDGRIRYEIKDEDGKPLLYLEKADENILYFTDADGRLLTGNEDFSYSLSRVF